MDDPCGNGIDRGPIRGNNVHGAMDSTPAAGVPPAVTERIRRRHREAIDGVVRQGEAIWAWSRYLGIFQISLAHLPDRGLNLPDRGEILRAALRLGTMILPHRSQGRTVTHLCQQPAQVAWARPHIVGGIRGIDGR